MLLFYSMGVVFVIGLLISLSAFIIIGASDTFQESVCFTSDCFEFAYSEFAPALSIMDATLRLLTTVGIAGGILVGLLNYLDSSHSNALSNHILHISVFKDFLSYEINKRTRIAMGSVDAFGWYNMIFENSRKGVMETSDQYVQAITRIKNIINSSNQKQKQLVDGGTFRYKLHQNEMISALSEIGITVEPSPRNDYYETEGEVFGLIETVNREFCFAGEVPKLPERKYL